MQSDNETVEDIVNEMREDDVRIASRETQKTEKLALSYACDWCKGYADRLESAWRREKTELRLAIDAEKARHTDTYKDERIRAQDAEIATLNEILKLAKDGLEAADDIIHIWCQNPALDGHAKLNDRVRKALAKVAEGGEK